MDLLKLARLQWDRATSLGLTVVGIVVLLAGYIGISRTEYVAAQMPYIISGGLTGIFLLGVAAMLWLSADLRDEWRELRQLRRSVEQHTAALEAGAAASHAESVPVQPAQPAPRPRARARQGQGDDLTVRA